MSVQPRSGSPSAALGDMDALCGDWVLRYAALVFLAGFLVHNADHFRRGVGVLTPEVLWAGSVSGVVTIVTIAMALVGYRHAPLLALVTGFSMALGVAAVHLLPRWSAFNDSLPDGGVDALSWAAVLLEIGGALAFGAAGAYALRRGTLGGAARSARATPPGVQ